MNKFTSISDQHTETVMKKYKEIWWKLDEDSDARLIWTTLTHIVYNCEMKVKLPFAWALTTSSYRCNDFVPGNGMWPHVSTSLIEANASV